MELLDINKTIKLLEKNKIPFAKSKLVSNLNQALKAADQIGYPLVLKVMSKKIVHKSDLGAIKTDIKDKEELEEEFDLLLKNIKKKVKGNIDGILLQKMEQGKEMIIGLKRDPQFGPCVMFGLGGIFTEVLKDVSFRVAPITEFDAEEMISEIKTSKLLDEFRGSPAVDRSALVKALIGIANLGLEHEEIAEIDINPLIICGDKPIAVDALVVLSENKDEDAVKEMAS